MQQQVRSYGLSLRLISMLLTVCMAISFLPVSAFAATELKTDDGILYKEDNGDIVITGYEGASEDMVIPSYIDGMPVREISMSIDSTYKNRIRSITIPETVTSISNTSFRDLKYLENIYFNAIDATLPNYTPFGGSGVNAPSLTITFGPNVEKIPRSILSENTALTEVVMSDSITEIDSYAFANCTSLTDITWSSNLRVIGWSAFSGCESLTEITIPERVQEIQDYAFTDCASLENIYFNAANCTTISSNGGPIFDNVGSDTNWNGKDLTLTFGSQVTAISGKLCGSKGGYITKVIIPENIQSIAAKAFSGCNYLQDVYVYSRTMEYPDNFENQFYNPFTSGSPTFHCYRNSTTDVYAQALGWDIQYFDEDFVTIRYDANRGSGAPSAQTIAIGQRFNISSKTPVRSGYTFLGWATSASASSAAYQPGQSLTAQSDMTLYAVWRQSSSGGSSGNTGSNSSGGNSGSNSGSSGSSSGGGSDTGMVLIAGVAGIAALIGGILLIGSAQQKAAPADPYARYEVVANLAERPYEAVYNYGYYRAANTDLAATFGNDRAAYLNHFLTSGMAEGRQACADFNVHAYRSNNADLAAAFGNDLAAYYRHYMQNGKAEGRVAK